MMDRHGYYMYGYGDGGHPHVLAWIVFALLIVLLVGLIVMLLSRWRAGGPAWAAGPTPPPSARPREDALELVRLRYARGEIDREAYLQLSQDLGGSAPPA